MIPRVKLLLFLIKNRRSILFESGKIFFAVCGGFWFLVEAPAFFLPEYMKWAQGNVWALCLYVVCALITTIFRVLHQVNAMLSVRERIVGTDSWIEIRVGDIFKMKGDFIIGTNTTFDTDTSSSLIPQDSLQGQLTKRCYEGRVRHLDRDLAESLAEAKCTLVENRQGKTERYEFGTVAKVSADDRNVYFVAIDELDRQGVAISSLENVRQSLLKLWQYIGKRGGFTRLVIPIMGTKSTGIQVPREVMITEIIESFISATYTERKFCEELTIVIYEKDYWAQDMDLDELGKFLHVRATERRWQIEKPDTPVGKSV